MTTPIQAGAAPLDRSSRWPQAARWRRVAAGLGLSAVAALPAPTTAADAVPAGKALFDRFCAECHAAGPGHPGTQQLGWTRAPGLSELEARKDLAPAYVRWVVRHGLMEMPPLRPTEINEAELEQLVQYLTRTAPRQPP